MQSLENATPEIQVFQKTGQKGETASTEPILCGVGFPCLVTFSFPCTIQNQVTFPRVHSQQATIPGSRIHPGEIAH